MGKNKNKSKFGMLSVEADIDNNPKPTQADRIVGAKGAAQFGTIKHLYAGGNISELLKSQPGSQSVLKPNRSVNNMSNMVRQQPRQPMGMDVSTNAQILNQAYDPRMAVNNMQGPAFVADVNSNTEKPKTKSQKRLEKTKQKAADARKETTSKETAAKGRVSKTKSKTQQKRDKTLRLEKRVKRQEGRQERKEIRKKAREGKMTRGEKRNAIIDSRDKQKGKGPAQVNKEKESKKNNKKITRKTDKFFKTIKQLDKNTRKKIAGEDVNQKQSERKLKKLEKTANQITKLKKEKGPAQVNQVEPTKDNKYGRNPDNYHKDANLNDRYPRRKEDDPRSKSWQKKQKEKNK